ncbi:class I SAM-dependent methyltransferase [bacterium]|nr:MAG: class I SAM-dependent methyltransferase [bacterium]
MESERNRVCPVELAGSLDNKIRRWLQDPQKILAPYVKEGMKVLDLGCGPGFFSIEMATMVGKTGKVFSADLQEGMLQKVCDKIKGTELEKRIQLVRCGTDSINMHERVDFILTFFMVHEVPDKNSLFKQLKSVLKENGQYLLVEPKLFHVSRKAWAATTKLAEENGFKVSPGPRMIFSWSAILCPR